MVQTWKPSSKSCTVTEMWGHQERERRYLFIYSVLGSCNRASWNAGWREINQQDATNPMFVIRLLSQHVSGTIYAHHQENKTVCYCIRCSALVVLAVCTVWSRLHTVHTAYDPAPHNHSQHNQCRTQYAITHGLVLLMMPETCWDWSFDNKHRISCILLVYLSSPCFVYLFIPRVKEVYWKLFNSISTGLCIRCG